MCENGSCIPASEDDGCPSYSFCLTGEFAFHNFEKFHFAKLPLHNT